MERICVSLTWTRHPNLRKIKACLVYSTAAKKLPTWTISPLRIMPAASTGSPALVHLVKCHREPQEEQICHVGLYRVSREKSPGAALYWTQPVPASCSGSTTGSCQSAKLMLTFWKTSFKKNRNSGQVEEEEEKRVRK